MSLDRLGAQLEIKSVEQRIITGFAAAGGLDRVGDVIDMSVAFRKTLSERRPSDVAVFVGHDMSSLPIGIPIEIEATPDGLKTVTRVFDGPAGDNLLAVAKGLQAAGQCLGMSIGYRVTESRPDRVDGKSVRRLTGIDLIEFSYAARQAIANPRALVTGVKAGGGQMTYTVEKSGDKYHVMRDGKSLASYDTEEAAKARSDALNSDDGKTVNDLPDSAFLVVEAGGQLDEGNRTVPRSKRHFPYRDHADALDAAALRSAVEAIPQAKIAGLDDQDIARLRTRVRRMIDSIERGNPCDETAEWKTGIGLDVLAVAYRLIDLSERVVTEHKAMTLLGESSKSGQRMRPEIRQSVREEIAELTRLVNWADVVDRDDDARARVAHYARSLELLEV